MIHLDCQSGLSGDMLAGALLDLGADFTRIKEMLKPVAKVSSKKTTKRGVKAVKFDVSFKPESRQYTGLVKAVKSLGLSKETEKMSLRILRVLAGAESAVHEVPLKKVHLHEAADCVVDSGAVSLALEELGALNDPFSSTVVSCGPLAPATQHIVREYGIPVKFISDKELLTPTGAALLAALNPVYQTMEYSGAGVGAGSMNLKRPNVVYAARTHPKVVLESNIDDCTPEQISHMTSRLMDGGALDVHVMPCMMKKGRLGFLVRVLTDQPEQHASTIMAETGSIGVRVHPVEYRFELDREIRTVKVKFGRVHETVRVKFTPLGYKPEFDDVSRLSKKHGLTFSEAGDKIDFNLSARSKQPPA